MVSVWKWFIFFLPVWGSILISYAFYRKADF